MTGTMNANVPPGPTSRFPGQTILAFRRDMLGFLGAVAREYGDIASFRVGPERIVLLNHPDHIRQVLVTDGRNFVKGRGLERIKRMLGEGLLTSEGEFHRRQRRLAQPAFHRQRIAGYGSTMVAYAARLCGGWRNGEALDIHHQMMRLTLGVVGATLFNADVESEAEEIGAAVTEALALFRLSTLPFSELLDGFAWLPHNRRFRRVRGRLDATIYRFIAERRASGRDHGDLLSMLLMATDAEADGAGMTDLQLRDEAMTIFLAGHETTANALTWTWYLLSRHPTVEAEMHAELDRVLGGRAPEVDDLPRLAYTRAVLAESMRMYPPAWVLGRRAVNAIEVGGYTVPARAIVLMSQYLTHRDARWFPNPGVFDPTRWTPDAEAARPKFSYYPFGGGSRICIGEAFAWMEGILMLATIAQRWRLRLVTGHPVALEPVVTLRPKFGMRVTVHARA